MAFVSPPQQYPQQAKRLFHSFTLNGVTESGKPANPPPKKARENKRSNDHNDIKSHLLGLLRKDDPEYSSKHENGKRKGWIDMALDLYDKGRLHEVAEEWEKYMNKKDKLKEAIKQREAEKGLPHAGNYLAPPTTQLHGIQPQLLDSTGMPYITIVPCTYSHMDSRLDRAPPLLPQTSLPQPTLPQPTIPQRTLPQHTLPQHTLRPTFPPQPGLPPHPSLLPRPSTGPSLYSLSVCESISGNIQDPLPFAFTRESELVLNTLGLGRLMLYATSKIYIIVVCGRPMSGTSTLCNLLLPEGIGRFPVTNAAVAKGIWISSPVRFKKGHLFVFDCHENHEHKLLALISILASGGGVLIRNERCAVNFETLALLASARAMVRGLPHADHPSLCLLLRDFDFELETDLSFAEYVSRVRGSEGGDNDSNMQVIRQSFSSIMIQTMPCPALHERGTQLPPGKFKDSVDLLRTKVLSILKSKKLNGYRCQGEMLVAFFKQCSRAINDTESFVGPGCESVIDSTCAALMKKVLCSYRKQMLHQVLPVEDVSLGTIHFQAYSTAMEAYKTSTFSLYPASVEKHLGLLKQEIGREYELIKSRNQAAHTEKSVKMLQDELGAARERLCELRKAVEEKEREAREAEQAAQEACARKDDADKALEDAQLLEWGEGETLFTPLERPSTPPLKPMELSFTDVKLPEDFVATLLNF